MSYILVLSECVDVGAFIEEYNLAPLNDIVEWGVLYLEEKDAETAKTDGRVVSIRREGKVHTSEVILK